MPVKVTLRPTDIAISKEHLLHDAFFLAIQRALGFPPFLHVGEEVVRVVQENGRMKEYRLSGLAKEWHQKSRMGENLKPLMFHLIEVDSPRGEEKANDVASGHEKLDR